MGHAVLISALAQPHLAYGRPILALLGDGPERQALEAVAARLRVADRVRFVGRPANPWPYYHAADVVVLPSDSEGPLIVNDRVYLATEEGDVVVVRAGSSLEVLATNTLADQSFVASPVAAGDALYLRSRTHLFAISGQ
ncbi:hypothetical protein BH23ACI1_BH23ACI1_11260 [soil metagenome]